jgi:hypothetical protein
MNLFKEENYFEPVILCEPNAWLLSRFDCLLIVNQDKNKGLSEISKTGSEESCFCRPRL